MRKLAIALRIVLAGLLCLIAAGGVAYWATDPGSIVAQGTSREPQQAPNPSLASEVERPKSDDPVIDKSAFESGGVEYAALYTGPIRDPKSLKELGAAIAVRGTLGLSVMTSELDQLHLGPNSKPEQVVYGLKLYKTIALLQMYEGMFAQASATFAKAMEIANAAGVPRKLRSELIALRGILALRQGEFDNCIGCIGPSSCIFPISADAAHTRQTGSREAIEHFSTYLKDEPGDIRIRWILNLAYMTLGEYPDKVPKRFLIPLDTFRPQGDVGRFTNVALAAGLTARGTNQAGGSIFDDFNGDNLPDIFTTSLDADQGASLFINKGDGTFENRSADAGLDDQVYVLNVARADYDNDGDADLLLLRGAWDRPLRLSLMKNKGDGKFEDVTLSAGMADPIQSEAVCWGDFDNDGFVDVFVCGEYYSPFNDPSALKVDPRNRCRLYHSKGDGTFEDVAEKAGVAAEICGKGSAWGDYDGDGKLDLFVSNMAGASKLYHNEGNGTFKDVGPELGVTGSDYSFACWFWDYDNDGKLDLYVNDNGVTLAESVGVAMGLPVAQTSSERPRLYHNEGGGKFREVAREVGLDRAMTAMGCNFGDIDNDGFLDFYQGTGGMSFSYLIPNLMLRNNGGKRFEDVTGSTATGHLQKGHGVSFADFDNDGNLDLFVESGGACPGDKSYNQLYKNPGQGRHWLKVKLVGKTTNRSALGARIKAVVKGPVGSPREIYRTIGNNSSFGGNTLVESLGLLDAKEVAELEISWPGSKSVQTFRNLAADRMVEITEGEDAIKPITPPTPNAQP